MEVSGKRADVENKSFCQNFQFCEHCQFENVTTEAKGICRECEEYMCDVCFRNHLKGKRNRTHELLKVNDPEIAAKKCAREVVKCQQHDDGTIKFYCRAHMAVGCGDCIVLEHSACKPEYIKDLSKDFQETEYFKNLRRKLGQLDCDNKANHEKIDDNRRDCIKKHEELLKEIRKYRKDINTCLDQAESAIISEAKQLVTETVNLLDQLENDWKDIAFKIETLEQKLDTTDHRDDELFIQVVRNKTNIAGLEQEIAKHVQGFCKVRHYDFVPDKQLCTVIKSTAKLGNLKCSYPNKSQREEADMEMHRIINNLSIDEDILETGAQQQLAHSQTAYGQQQPEHCQPAYSRLQPGYGGQESYGAPAGQARYGAPSVQAVDGAPPGAVQQPAYGHPAYEQQQPAYGLPDYGHQQPAYGLPDYEQQQPVYSQPDYEQQQPGYGQRDYEQQQTGYCQPDYGKLQPGYGGQALYEVRPVQARYDATVGQAFNGALQEPSVYEALDVKQTSVSVGDRLRRTDKLSAYEADKAKLLQGFSKAKHYDFVPDKQMCSQKKSPLKPGNKKCSYRKRSEREEASVAIGRKTSNQTRARNKRSVYKDDVVGARVRRTDTVSPWEKIVHGDVGTVTSVGPDGSFSVKWDRSKETFSGYRIGSLKLV